MSSTGGSRQLLEELATGFAQTLQDLLRASICPDAVMEYKPHRRPRLGQPVGVVRPADAGDLPVRWEDGDSIAALRISFNVTLDERDGRYLMVHKSGFALVAAQVSAAPIIRWEFERDKHSYAAAHIQVHATSHELDQLLAMADRKRPMKDVHFPAGSKRYRSTLEDVVEFLVQEGLAHPLAGWDEHIERNRAEFAKHQPRGAVARHPVVALGKLHEDGLLTDGEFREASRRAGPSVHTTGGP